MGATQKDRKGFEGSSDQLFRRYYLSSKRLNGCQGDGFSSVGARMTP